jgi:hypothetical protein
MLSEIEEPLRLTPSAPQPEIMQVLVIHLEVVLPILIPFDAAFSMAHVWTVDLLLEDKSMPLLVAAYTQQSFIRALSPVTVIPLTLPPAAGST